MRAHSRSNQRSTPQGQQQVWLPGLQVWAALGSRADRPYTSSTTQAATVLRADRTPLAQPKMPSTSTAVSLPVQTSPKAGPKATNATAQAAGDTHESLPHCPICLTDIIDPQDKAVVNSCMHVFCVDCIARWALRKRVCPLCKGRIQGYLYNIQSDSDYSERVIPPSPERTASPHNPFEPPRASRWGPLPSAPTPYLTSFFSSPSLQPSNPQAAPDLAARWQSTAQHYFGSSSHQLHTQGGNRAIMRPSRLSSRQQQEGGNAMNAVREPRPYYYRVQQQMQAGLTDHTHQSGPRPQTAPVDAGLAWRRNIYADNMWAVAAGSAPAAIPSLAAAPKRARRLQDWANRELQALLDQQDVSIVRSFVMSLANTHGLDHHQAHVLSRDASARTADAVRALQPFLHDRTEHFWHELKCFAEAPYSMAAYDRMVQYQWRSPDTSQAASLVASAQQLSQQAQHAAQRAQQRQPQRAQQRQPQHAQQHQPQLAQHHGTNVHSHGWDLPWCNSPYGTPPQPTPQAAPPAATGAVIDLTAPDSSPAPSSSAGYHHVSTVEPSGTSSAPPTLPNSLASRSSSPSFTSSASATSAPSHRRSRLNGGNSQQQQQQHAKSAAGDMLAPRSNTNSATSASALHTNASTQAEDLSRAAKRRRWDVMPGDMPAAAARPNAAASAQDNSRASGHRGITHFGRTSHQDGANADDDSMRAVRHSDTADAHHEHERKRKHREAVSSPEQTAAQHRQREPLHLYQNSGQTWHLSSDRHRWRHQPHNRQANDEDFDRRHAGRHRSSRHSRSRSVGGYAAVADGCIGQASDVHPDGRGVQLRGSHSRRGSDMPEQPSVDTDRWQLWQPGMRM